MTEFVKCAACGVMFHWPQELPSRPIFSHGPRLPDWWFGPPTLEQYQADMDRLAHVAELTRVAGLGRKKRRR